MILLMTRSKYVSEDSKETKNLSEKILRQKISLHFFSIFLESFETYTDPRLSEFEAKQNFSLTFFVEKSLKFQKL